jgi:hypothetical protein
MKLFFNSWWIFYAFLWKISWTFIKFHELLSLMEKIHEISRIRMFMKLHETMKFYGNVHETFMKFREFSSTSVSWNFMKIFINFSFMKFHENFHKIWWNKVVLDTPCSHSRYSSISSNFPLLMHVETSSETSFWKQVYLYM